MRQSETNQVLIDYLMDLTGGKLLVPVSQAGQLLGGIDARTVRENVTCVQVGKKYFVSVKELLGRL